MAVTILLFDNNGEINKEYGMGKNINKKIKFYSLRSLDFYSSWMNTLVGLLSPAYEVIFILPITCDACLSGLKSDICCPVSVSLC
jgi:hypothetical protein